MIASGFRQEHIKWKVPVSWTNTPECMFDVEVGVVEEGGGGRKASAPNSLQVDYTLSFAVQSLNALVHIV